MNPFDAVGTARVSQAIADRMCRVVLGYQDEAGERAITSSVSGLNGRSVELSVALTRATRGHRDVRMGSSVRGAIDLALVLTGLAELRGEADPGRETARDAAYAALSGRIRIADGVDRTPESVIDELLDAHWSAPTPTSADPEELTRREKLTACRARRQASSPGPAPAASGPGAPIAAPSWPPTTRPSTRSRPRSGSWTRPRSTRRWAATRRRRPRCWPTSRWPPTPAAGRGPAAGRPGVPAARPDRTGAVPWLPPAGPVPIPEGDLDLDRTLDGWLPELSRRPGPADIVTRTWTAHRRSVALVVDISGSMQGLAVALAAVAAAGVVLANEHGPPQLEPSVLAFGASVRVLQAQGVRRPPEDLLSELVALRGHGVTDLAAGLRAASRQLAGAAADQRLVVLLSDCLHTAGDDPGAALGGIDRLHVLVPLGGAEAEAAAAALAGRGGGRAQTVRRLGDIGPALTRVLG